MLQLLQSPIVIDVAPAAQAAAPARDISIDVIISIFVLAGLFLLAAAIGSLIVGGIIVLIKRRRDSSMAGAQHHDEPTHTQLRI